jgi:hypothetical protein
MEKLQYGNGAGMAHKVSGTYPSCDWQKLMIDTMQILRHITNSRLNLSLLKNLTSPTK